MKTDPNAISLIKRKYIINMKKKGVITDIYHI
jgi:hypothetical protein